MNTSILAFWAPIVCIIAFLIIVAIAYAFRSRGQQAYSKDTEQTKVFLSGEDTPEDTLRHVRSHNMYWGFFESMKRYYDPLIRAHTGLVNDYLAWTLGLGALAGLVIVLAGLLL